MMTNSAKTDLASNIRDSIHTIQIDQVYQALGTRPAGLTLAEAQERLQRFGPNLIREAKGELIIPRGDTVLQLADEVLVVVHASQMADLAQLLSPAG
jgi:Trk K+ transport system NAD-binding subunit